MLRISVSPSCLRDFSRSQYIRVQVLIDRVNILYVVLRQYFQGIEIFREIFENALFQMIGNTDNLLITAYSFISVVEHK